MKFVFYASLKTAAKRAFDKGNGRHGKFFVDDGHIAVVGKDGRCLDFIKVIKNNNPIIKEKK